MDQAAHHLGASAWHHGPFLHPRPRRCNTLAEIPYNLTPPHALPVIPYRIQGLVNDAGLDFFDAARRAREAEHGEGVACATTIGRHQPVHSYHKTRISAVRQAPMFLNTGDTQGTQQDALIEGGLDDRTPWPR
jgi:hypothetical protein